MAINEEIKAICEATEKCMQDERKAGTLTDSKIVNYMLAQAQAVNAIIEARK